MESCSFNSKKAVNLNSYGNGLRVKKVLNPTELRFRNATRYEKSKA
jgi:hypothetical protein